MADASDTLKGFLKPATGHRIGREHRVPSRKRKLDLGDLPTRYEGDLDKQEAKDATADLIEEAADLQRTLFAENRQSLLVVLQAMDAAGKDSAVRRCFSGFNPAGVRVTSFKSPTSYELDHDFLWRVHPHAPAAGEIAVFNRSHYEDVLIVRVREWAPEPVWRGRYDHINAFESLLADRGTRVLKFFLHVSRDYQAERLQRRLDLPDKLWKFNPADLIERGYWDDYQAAFADAFTRCNTPAAPWFVVPSERRWYRDLFIAKTVRDTLLEMDPQFPEPTVDPADYTIE